MQALTSTPWDFAKGNASEEPPVGSPNSSFSPSEDHRLSLALEDSLRISVAALVFAAFCGWGILLPFCLPQKLRMRGEAWRWLSIHANGLVCVGSVLDLVALILWIYDQGLSATLVLPMLLLFYVVMVTLLIVVTHTFRLDFLQQVKDKAGQRLLNFTTPGGMVLVAVTSSVLIKQINLLQVKANAEPADLTSVIAGTSGISLPPLVVTIVLYCKDLRKQEVEGRISRKEKQRELAIILRTSPLSAVMPEQNN